MRTRLLMKALPAVMVTVCLISCDSTEVRVPDGPNVLIITADTLRADYLGSYGNDGGHTPHLDKLASEGTLFSNCRAPIATTFPSHATIFSGLYPRYHGVRWNGHNLHGDVETLAEILERHGWDTAAFVAVKAMLVRGGLDQGFRHVSDTEQKRGAPRVRSGWDVNDLVAKWLDERETARPFLLWVHYYEPHGPYPVTPYAREAMAPSGYDGPFLDGVSIEELKQNDLMNDPANRQALRSLYAGRVRETDDLVGELLGMFENHGLEEDTVVIFTSDHGQLLGESLGKKRRVGHGGTLFEPALRTPLIIKDPSGPPPAEVDVMVGLIDLMPTVLDLLGLDAPARCQGRSLRLLRDGTTLENATYLAEIKMPKRDTDRSSWVDRIAVYQGGMKVVYPEKLVYDLSRESPDFEPVAPKPHEDLIERLDAVANRFFNHQGSPDAEYDLDEDDFAELRALGYIQ